MSSSRRRCCCDAGMLRERIVTRGQRLNLSSVTVLCRGDSQRRTHASLRMPDAEAAPTCFAPPSGFRATGNGISGDRAAPFKRTRPVQPRSHRPSHGQHLRDLRLSAATTGSNTGRTSTAPIVKAKENSQTGDGAPLRPLRDSRYCLIGPGRFVATPQEGRTLNLSSAVDTPRSSIRTCCSALLAEPECAATLTRGGVPAWNDAGRFRDLPRRMPSAILQRATLSQRRHRDTLPRRPTRNSSNTRRPVSEAIRQPEHPHTETNGA